MKHSTFRVSILTLLLSMVCTYSFADGIKIGDIYYLLSGKQATVTTGGMGSYSGNITIPETVNYNGIIYSVTSIGDDAFDECSGLTSITIPNSVTSIGSYVFAGCSGLISIQVASGNSNYDSRDNCNAIIETNSNTLIAGCKNTIIPNSVTSIGDWAFYRCYGLTSVTIPSSVTSIGGYAFSHCSGLTSVTIPNSVTSIGGNAFYYCSGLTSVTIPNSVTSIRSYVFAGCSGLTSIQVASGNSNYDSRDNCNAIIETNSNTLIAGCKNTIIPNSVTSIGDWAFYRCYGLTSITIPSSVTSIGNKAFYGCTGLTSVTIPNSVTSIGGYAFYYTGLTSVTIPNSVTSIGDGAFFYCTGLTSVTIPNSVTSIGYNAFGYCTGLTSITIPNSVTSIGSRAFDSCSGLTSVTVLKDEPITIIEDFFETRNRATLYVPAGSKAAYEAAEFWKEFKEIIEIEDVSATDISEMEDAIYVDPTEVISGNQAVLSVKMKNNVTIQTIQFDLYLPEGVTVVSNEDQELITASKERINKFNYFNSTMQANGALRLLAQATTTNVPAGDGEICRVTVNVPESMDEGDYPIIFKDILMVEANNTSHSPDPNVVQCKLTVLPYTLGDANNDGDINAIDFNMIGNYILGNHSQANFSFRAADFNNDGDINAIDFNMVGNYILYGSSAPSSRATRKEETLDPQ